jgi:hypothetical protein
MVSIGNGWGGWLNTSATDKFRKSNVIEFNFHDRVLLEINLQR